MNSLCIKKNANIKMCVFICWFIISINYIYYVFPTCRTEYINGASYHCCGKHCKFQDIIDTREYERARWNIIYD